MGNWSGKAHEWLSRNALMPLSAMYCRLRPSRRPATKAFDESLRFRRHSAAWDEARKREWVLERLRDCVRRAAETRYYGELFRRIGFDPRHNFTFDDFARLPALERADIRRAGSDLLSKAVKPRQLRKAVTGISGGEPTDLWLGPEERGWLNAARTYFLARAGVEPGWRKANLWSHDPAAGGAWRERVHDFIHDVRRFDCLRQSPEIFERYHLEFERWQPACITAYASVLGYFAEYLQERGYRPSYPTRCFETGAEKLLPHHREVVEKVFNRPVHERYGSRAAGYSAFQVQPLCSLDYEVDWCNVLLEPETSAPESAILITKLHADGMPMIRYRSGDLGRFAPGAKPGHPAFVFHEVIGRETDRLWLPDGRWLAGVQFPQLLKGYPVREFMFVQRADYSVELSIVPKSGFGEQVWRKVLSTMRSNLPGVELKLTLVDHIPRTRSNKWRPVVSEVRPALKGQAPACRSARA